MTKYVTERVPHSSAPNFPQQSLQNPPHPSPQTSPQRAPQQASTKSLVILAAGMGSRYGGLKQMDPVGPSRELLIDYSLYDAYQAGFRRVVFIIKKAMHQDFEALIGSRIAPYFEIAYAYQELSDLPQDLEKLCPGRPVEETQKLLAQRQKPWGTGHALLTTAELVPGPFAVINADDYYGPDAFRQIFQALDQVDDHQAYMVAYWLDHTLSDHGHVSRGLCDMKIQDGQRLLDRITERKMIRKVKPYDPDQPEAEFSLDQGETWTRISAKALCSMNFWGFSPAIFPTLDRDWRSFLQMILDPAQGKDPLKAEFLLPEVVEKRLLEGTMTCKVLESNDQWIGMTYQEDKAVVQEKLQALVNQGTYSCPLWANK